MIAVFNFMQVEKFRCNLGSDFENFCNFYESSNIPTGRIVFLRIIKVG